MVYLCVCPVEKAPKKIIMWSLVHKTISNEDNFADEVLE